MKGLLFLLCCIEILGVLLCGADDLQASPTPDPINSSDPAISLSQNNVLDPSTAVLPTTSVSTSTLDKLISSQSAETISRDSKSPPSTPQPGPKHNTFIDTFFKGECLSLLMVTSGLFVGCTLLLLATLLLACKVCRLSRRIKVLSSDSDIISSSENGMGTAKKDKSKPEEEPRETTVLMADVNQTQEEVGNGAAKEGGEKVNADEQTEEEEKRMEEEGDAAKTEEASAAPVAAAENSSPPKQQEEATDSQPDDAAAASASEGTEEAKDVV
ncbi:uncharacterized protein LOC119030713 [Acanthopagrus latus]|uniref:uncharacterized protein LOC119030713 n=1 Tax=Acanthopagrus latus TaxID=8177 RepID=UPI00187CFDCC|nr:uncharacterized protein LOC119030713 [Acanthopagrus latus]